MKAPEVNEKVYIFYDRDAKQLLKGWHEFPPQFQDYYEYTRSDITKALVDALREIKDIEQGCKDRGCGYDVSVHETAKAALAKYKKTQEPT